MYKKITHSIQEEHFDHPALAEYAIKTGNIKPITGNIRQPNSADLVLWPIDGNCDHYSGNIMVPMAGPVYMINRDVEIHGNILVSGNIISAAGHLHGVGTTTTVIKLAESPPTSNWPGQQGELAVDKTYMYLCVENGKWVRWPVNQSW